MRTMVALVFVLNLTGQVRPVALRAPQRPNANEPIEALEKYLVQVPDDVPTRIALLRRFVNAPEGLLPPELIRRERRKQILWMIEHHPDSGELANPIAVIDPKGRFADPEGFAEASKAWWSRAAVPGTPPKVAANAIFFFRFNDPAAARNLLEYGLKAHPRDGDLARMQGMLDAIAFTGVTEADYQGNIVAADGAKSPASVKAREEIEALQSGGTAGGAGQFIMQQSGFLSRELTLGDEDPLAIAERWLTHARQLEPKNEAWIDSLMQIYQRDAGQALDPHAKEQYLARALEIADTHPRQMRVLNDLMEAEFDSGNAPKAADDAQQLLDIATVNPTVGNFDQMVHDSETMLGRVALEQGQRKEAVGHLMESAKVKLGGAPKMTLAQDLLDAGERDAVVRYLDACRAFWKFDEGRIDHAENLIRTEAKPDILTPWRPAGLALIRQKAPAFDLTDLAGKQWKLDQLNGRPIALVFWNAACAGCRDELQAMEAVGTRDYFVLAVNTGDDPAHIADYVSRNHIALPVAIGGREMIRKFAADSLPALAVIDRSGEIAAYSVGSITADTLHVQIAKGIAGRPLLAAPAQNPKPVIATSDVTVSWAPVAGAESYLVEWDARDEKGWISDRDGGFVHVVPTRETSAVLGFTAKTGRWRVYAVSARAGSGHVSEWREFVCQRP